MANTSFVVIKSENQKEHRVVGSSNWFMKYRYILYIMHCVGIKYMSNIFMRSFECVLRMYAVHHTHTHTHQLHISLV